MSTIKIEPSQQQAFTLAREPTMVVDETGHIVGMFHPMPGCPFTLEELERRAAEPGTGRTTAEVLADLQRRFPARSLLSRGNLALRTS